MSKKLFISILVLCILTLGLLVLDLMKVIISKWIIIILMCAIAGLSVFFIVKGEKKAPKVISTILAVVTIAISFFAISMSPYFNSISLHNFVAAAPYDAVVSADDACDEIDYATRTFQRIHPKHSDEAVMKTADKIKEQIQEDGGVTVNQLSADIERVLSKAGDPHTYAWADYNDYLVPKDYDMNKMEKGVWHLVKVNGLTAEDVLSQNPDLVSFDTKSCGEFEVDRFLNPGGIPYLQILDFYGFDTQKDITCTYENESGEQMTETYHPDDFMSYDEYLEKNVKEEDEEAEEAEPPIATFEIDKDKSLAVLTYNDVWYEDEYKECLQDMFTQVKEKGIKNVVVDLRGVGGDRMVMDFFVNTKAAEEFIRYLDVDNYNGMSSTWRLGFYDLNKNEENCKNKRYSDLTFNGNCYVLTSSDTFGPASTFAMLIKDNDLGTLIGEPTGSDPNGYGEDVWFATPKTKIKVIVSTKQFYRADRDCKDKCVTPDIECDADKAFDALYEAID